ncbi:2,3-bisphosphoglycerate-dependent phosphoglycerate mutase [Aerococcus sp. Group 1]|uniref:2,3-bisphosphoglycerate-dependent phosphoglycerate mutase n=1 Tax=Aerococcus urinae (strain CCUG 59500 / ACS-120-V-Col10a) TaxID=2976812 RepID=UPI000200FD64|nr:2,3-diphosphoglycerate-dependent phosphoglycerate mutase [Aerococcus sp. Group 1]AEA01080.1 phosphoglycerate mutase 1 family [Aerococcus sp. Group 1]MCY3031140.1 2,3-diphosphoglycerate-dependent phosphoglycerate mutase [Aerococcus sp. Group 1]MCY3054224.1 2,3-diphosphoglycerate-dependent phosphoglycerate mutase [Aerococcus sp. Group 1]MCY3055954.1 2,3-diphosphoglycerate-dependent phosphoglycerate mutase [Aerococcus sp. Group 1]MCY3061900.1 2,3-diphosphoglycerate-dependent phosphoglycerate m
MLILLRHGQSSSNLNNLFTGWYDAKLTQEGKDQAYAAGRRLKAAGIHLDTVHTSLLSRAIQTTNIVLEAMDQLYLPLEKSWRLNGRHYGALEGMNKDLARKKFGPDQVHAWRRSYDVRPPEATDNELSDRYPFLDSTSLPQSESLKDTQARLLPYLEDRVIPQIKQGENVLIVSHGNLLRALTLVIEDLDPSQASQIEIANALPIVYHFDQELQIKSKEILNG